MAGNTATATRVEASAVGERAPRFLIPGVAWRSVLTVLLYLGGLVLALVWLRSSAAHLANPYFFLSSVYRYELVGPATGQIVAMILPLLQLFLAVCLIGRIFVRGALLLSTVLLGIFLAVQISAVWRELKISCGCFGAVSSDPVGATSISIVGALLVLAVLCLLGDLFAPPSRNGEDHLRL